MFKDLQNLVVQVKDFTSVAEFIAEVVAFGASSDFVFIRSCFIPHRYILSKFKTYLVGLTVTTLY
jgi:hypothetical protein